MMGHSHALSGAVTGAAVAELVLHAPLPEAAALTVLCAGFATLPDLDQCGSTAARSLGFLSEAWAVVVRAVSGGHRHGTHSILGTAVVTGIVWAAAAYRAHFPARIVLGLMLALTVAAGLRALRLAGSHAADVAGIAAAAAVAWFGLGLGLLPLACAVGCATHIAGDMLTVEGCPLAWPASLRDYRVLPRPLAFRAGAWPEHLIVVPALAVALLVLAWQAAAVAIPGLPRL